MSLHKDKAKLETYLNCPVCTRRYFAASPTRIDPTRIGQSDSQTSNIQKTHILLAQVFLELEFRNE